MQLFKILEKIALHSKDRYIKGHANELVRRKRDILEILQDLDDKGLLK